MRAKFEICNPQTVEMELTVRMPLQDWRKIRMKLLPEDANTSSEWAIMQFTAAIREMIAEAEQTFWCHAEEEDSQEDESA